MIYSLDLGKLLIIEFALDVSGSRFDCFQSMSVLFEVSLYAIILHMM
jgi:hypothetical protein